MPSSGHQSFSAFVTTTPAIVAVDDCGRAREVIGVRERTLCASAS
jgi:hypothetical protein